MDELVKTFGSEDSLLIELRWDAWHADEAPCTAAEVTRGSLRLALRGQVLWKGGDPGEGFWWTWVELLEFLAQAWPYLIWEDGLPFGLRPAGPSAITAQAESRWDELSGEIRESEEEVFEAFEEVHDLARAVQGAIVPSIWIVREGEYCWLCSDARSVRRPLDQVVSTLQGVGEEIASRLRTTFRDERADLALRAWEKRTAIAPSEAILIATGLPDHVRAQIEKGRPPTDAWGLREDAFELNELLATARLAAGLPASTVARLVEAVRSVPRISAPTLDTLAEGAMEVLAPVEQNPPFEQGHHVASWLRRELGIDSDQRADPEAILKDSGVEVELVRLEVPDVDAFACWGPSHGPVVFLNTTGRHNLSTGGQRATFAHELAHLLVDRRGALPLAEVLGGRTSPMVEARARAFAAEFLLPADRAGAAMTSAVDPQRTLRVVQQRYGVSQEVVAWQARNSGYPLSRAAEELLRTKVSQPSQF